MNMELTVHNDGGTIRVHKAGCRDLPKDAQRDPDFLFRAGRYAFKRTVIYPAFANLKEVLECFPDKGDMQFYPCTKS
jgi:hypothetical protein